MGCENCKRKEDMNTDNSMDILENCSVMHSGPRFNTVLESNCMSNTQKSIHNKLKDPLVYHTRMCENNRRTSITMNFSKSNTIRNNNSTHTADAELHCISLEERQAGKVGVNEKSSFGKIDIQLEEDKLQNERSEKPEEDNIKEHKLNIAQLFIPQVLNIAKTKKAQALAFDPAALILENKSGIQASYQVLEILGKGAFGEVRKVRHRGNLKIYAMKVISKSSVTETDNMMNEIEILKKLDHPNIVRLYEFAFDANSYYLITEYCEGGELLNLIVRLKTFNERIAANIMRQVLSAVVYCHSRHIVHRDLKPENLVLEAKHVNSNIKVIDFGTSKIFKSREKMKDVLGTAYYIAPEVLKENYNEKCDVWSCGVILYVMLCGAPPFTGSNPEEIMRKVEKGVFSFTKPVWKEVSGEAICLIKKMMTYNPKQRISAEEALNDPWIIKNVESKQMTGTILKSSLENLRKFKAPSALQKAVLTYLASHSLTKEEEKKQREIFTKMDTNHDGQLSVEELVEGYKVANGGNAELAKHDADKVFKSIDINQNGSIDYNEFLVASLQQSANLNKQKLKIAFDFIDENHSGQISCEEIGRLFSGIAEKDIIKHIFSEVDVDGDGKVTFEEFSKMMGDYVNKKDGQHLK